MFRSKDKQKEFPAVAQDILDKIKCQACEQHHNVQTALFNKDVMVCLPEPSAWLAQQYRNSSTLRIILVGTRPDTDGQLVCPEYTTLLSELEDHYADVRQQLNSNRDAAEYALANELQMLCLRLEQRTREMLCNEEITDGELMKGLLDELAKENWTAVPAVETYLNLKAVARGALIEKYKAVLASLDAN